MPLNKRKRVPTLYVGAYLTCFLLAGCGAKGIAPTIAGDAGVQSSVANGSVLQTVSATDPTVAQAVDSSQPGAVSAAAGSNTNVKGAIANIIYPASGSGADMVVFFGAGGQSTQVHIPASLFNQLPDMRQYIGKPILVKGNIRMGTHLPLVEVRSSADVKAIQ